MSCDERAEQLIDARDRARSRSEPGESVATAREGEEQR
jgi:hypothetical protein